MAGKAIEVNEAEFDSVILGADKPAVVDFWAIWCGPCKKIAPIMEDLAGKYEGKAVFAKVDVDTNRNLAMRFGIQSIPTLLFFKNGEVVDRVIGFAPKQAQVIESKLQALLD